MPPVTGPTSATIDPDLASRLGSPQAVDALKRGDVHEVLRISGISARELDDYLKNQSRNLTQHVIQTDAIYSDYGSMHAPQWGAQFSPELGVGKMVPEDHAAFAQTLSKMTGKAVMAAGKSAEQVADPNVPPADLAALAQGYTAEAQQMIDALADKALENTLQMQLKKGDAELKQKLLQIVANAKDPSTILLALTQYSARKAGLVAAQAGTRVGLIQKQQSRLAADQGNIAADDPKFYAKTEGYRQKMSEGATTLQQQVSLMQTATQNVEAAMSFGKSSLDKLNELASTLIRSLQVRGG